MTLILLPPTSVSNDGEFRLLFRGSARRPPPRRRRRTTWPPPRIRRRLFISSPVRRFEQRQPLILPGSFDFRLILSSPLNSRIELTEPLRAPVRCLVLHRPRWTQTVGLDGFADGHRQIARNAFRAMAMRCCGAFSRNMILRMSSSFDGRLASC